MDNALKDFHYVFIYSNKRTKLQSIFIGIIVMSLSLINGASSYAPGSGDNHIGTSVKTLPDGSYIAVGFTEVDPLRRTNIILFKTRPGTDGEIEWSQQIGSTPQENAIATSVEATVDDEYLIAGLLFETGEYDAFLLKTDNQASPFHHSLC